MKTYEVRSIEIQFAGYAAEPLLMPLRSSPFSSAANKHLKADDAEEIIQAALMSDGDDNGWCAGDANGESFQVRVIMDDKATPVYIRSFRDLKNHVDSALGSEATQAHIDEATDLLQFMEHPPYGDNWGPWMAQFDLWELISE